MVTEMFDKARLNVRIIGILTVCGYPIRNQNFKDVFRYRYSVTFITNGDHLQSPNSVRPAIAIDGPAASGKSSAGKMFASQLDYRFLDTGLMYRAATWDAMNNGIDINKPEAVSDVVAKMEFSVIDGDSGENLILVNGQDVTRFLHSTAVDVSVSPVSAITVVRKIMVAEQRRIATAGNIVMVGRDIGTVVIPDAPLKIFLTASAETRANRRYSEFIANGTQVDLADILSSIVQRDRIDSSREDSPLKPAADAHMVDTDDLSLNEVVALMVGLSKEII